MEFLRDGVFLDGININKHMISTSIEMEDDAYYADLDRQMSLLIMDDDDDEDHDISPGFFHSASFQGIPQSVRNPNYVLLPTCCQQTDSIRPMNKGTGVFIPRQSQPGRKTKRGKHGPRNAKSSSRNQIVSSKEMMSHHYVANSTSPSQRHNYLNYRYC